MNLLLVITLDTLAIGTSAGTCSCKCCSYTGCTAHNVGSFDSTDYSCTTKACANKFTQCPDSYSRGYNTASYTSSSDDYSSTSDGDSSTASPVVVLVVMLVIAFLFVGVAMYFRNKRLEAQNKFALPAARTGNPYTGLNNGIVPPPHRQDPVAVYTIETPPPQHAAIYQPPSVDPQGGLQQQYQKYQQYQAQPAQYPAAEVPAAANSSKYEPRI